MEGAHEELEPDDGVDDDNKNDKHGNVDQRDDGHQNGVHNDLQT